MVNFKSIKISMRLTTEKGYKDSCSLETLPIHNCNYYFIKTIKFRYNINKV